MFAEMSWSYVVWEKLSVSIVFPTCVSIPMFQTFEMGLETFRNFENKIIWDKRS